MVKISKEKFFSELEKQLKEKDNYNNNLSHNVGRWKYHNILRCEINGEIYYFGGYAKNANTDISVIKRLCN